MLHVKKYANPTIKIYSDNLTALKYTTKQGGTTSHLLQQLAVDIQGICNEYRAEVIYQHVPGVQNHHADKLSRTKKPLYEQSIPKKFFQQIHQKWGPLQVDAHINQLEK
jgi:hypothetical protein